MKVAFAALLLILPGFALGAGGGGNAPPKPSETTKDCFQERQGDPDEKVWVRFSRPVTGVWDASVRTCVPPD
jgi:hypothetical protein